MYALRSKGSLPLSFNDHSNLLNERFERNPLHLAPCCACCSCTSLYIYRVPTYPNLLYGVRQSKLLQWSVYGVERYVSRLPAYGAERYFPRQLVYGVNRGCCEVHSCFRERSLCNRSGKRRQRCVNCCCCRESDEESEFDYQVGVDEADDVLSLLSEGMNKVCGRVRRRYGSSYKRLEAGINRNHDRRKVSSSTKVQEQKEGDNVSELNGVKRKLAELESDLNRHHVVRSARRKKAGEGSEQQDVLAKCENHKRVDVSSRSSYHSVSSSGDFSSDAGIEDKCTQLEGDLSIGYEKGRGQEGLLMGKVVEASARQREYSKRLGESSDWKNLKVEGDVNLNSRKYRESKIAGVMQQMQSRRGSSQKNLEVLRSHDIEEGQSASISHKKFNSQERNSSLPMNMADTRAEQYHGNQVMVASALPRLKSTETPESHAGYFNSSSGLKETYLGTEEDMETSTTSMQETSDYVKERVNREDDLYVHSVKVISEIEDMNKTSNLSKQEDIRRMKLGGSQISVQDAHQQLHQSGESSTVCRLERSKSETLESSRICESNIHHSNITKIQNMNHPKEKNSNLISGSSSEAMKTHFVITERMPQRVLSLRESKVVTDKSQLPSGGAETVTLRRNSDEESMNQDTYSSSSFKSFVDMRDIKCQTDENIREFGSRHVAQSTKVLSSSQVASEEASGLQGSLHLRTEIRMKQRKREVSERSTREMGMHPSLLQPRVSAQSEPTTRISSSEVHNETLEGSSSALFVHLERTVAFQSEMDSDKSDRAYHKPLDTITPEDSLGSGDQLEKVSSQYVSESTEEVGSELQSAIEAGKSRKTGLTKSVSQEGMRSELASNSSFGDSGAKFRHESAISKTLRETESSKSQLAFEVGKSDDPSNTINTDDSLGSTDLDKLSSKAVGDISLEVTNSENQRETEGSKFQSPVTVGKCWRMSSSHDVSHEGSQFELSSSLSGSSRVKGPSFLKQDIREPSVPSSLQPARCSAQGGPTTIITNPEVSSGISERSDSALSMHSGGTTSLEAETRSADESGQTYVDPLEKIHPEDSLGSNDRLEKISSQFIGEFLDKARHGVMVSSNQGEIEGSELQSSAEIDESRNNNSYQYDGQEGRQLEIASTHSSGGFGLMGPSDIMWDVRGPSVPEISKAEEPMVASANEKAVVKRTGRSFWSIIVDVVRLRWGSHANAYNLTGQSGGSSSSEKSAGTEAWFSANEHEDNVKNSVRSDQTITPPGPSTSDQLQQRKKFSQSEGKMTETVGSKEMKSPALTRTGTTSESTSASEKVSFGKVNPRTGKAKSSEGLLTGKQIVELSVSLPETELPVAGENEAELKCRKLQRTKQVTRDRFDYWEEAYKLEREQKIIDEIFMREALKEAKKAADAWEVPVGAVLVQRGKIISRGSNLVEEFRDSTAHAEMICIREASNLLRTWRLSETTLYVTLEPCPMCAGAILQARIDVVVWGAPNKLLGADGSWVRLFPDEGDGSECRDKPAAPVHPFHPKVKIRRGILASECADVMQQFFRLRRKKKKAEPSSSHSSLLGSHHPAKLLTKMHDIFHFMFC